MYDTDSNPFYKIKSAGFTNFSLGEVLKKAWVCGRC